MGLFLEFDELPLDAQVWVATQSGGCISGRAVPAGGGGASKFNLVKVAETDHVFNGNGSGGAVQLSPMTIVQCLFIDAPVTWKLANAGVGDGWIVAFNIEGADPGAVTITDDSDANLQIINTANPTGPLNNFPYPIFYFDLASAQWRTLRSRILNP